jgi:hypothetical protein
LVALRNGTLYTIALGIALAVALVGPSIVDERAAATHQPADKIAISGSGVEVMNAGLTSGSSSDVHTLATGTLRTSSPTDLIFRVTAECALWTDIATVGNAESEAVASVKMWIELDGNPVAVASDDTGEEAGKVVFCNRAYRMETLNFDEDATIKQYLKTRSANAFNWITLNVGSGIHSVALKTQLDSSVSGTGFAKAAVGKRTLIVEPVKLANDAFI